jgi:hypothetical protein
MHHESRPNWSKWQHTKKKTLLVLEGDQRANTNSNIEGKVTCTLVQRHVALSSISPKKERDIIELFHIKIHPKKTKVDCLFSPIS